MAFRNDYIMRLIEQFSQTFGVLLGLKRRQEPEKEIAVIDEALKRMLGLNGRLVNRLSERDLIGLLTQEGYGQFERLATVAGLLKAGGDAYARMGDEAAAFSSRKKALRLFLHVGARGADLSFLQLQEEIASLLDELAAYELPRETKLELWRYYAEVGRYADAEDVLFELLEDEPSPTAGMHPEDLPSTPHLLKEAVSFYERLLLLDDAALEAGNLPRSEVEDALRELRQRAGAGPTAGS